MEPAGAYDTIRDFQPLIAALVAILAASIAYRSTQNAALKAQATAQYQITHALEKESESSARRRIAFMIMLQTRLLLLRAAIQYRMLLLDNFKKVAQIRPDGFTVDTATPSLHFSSIYHLRPLAQEMNLSAIKWEDIGTYLDFVQQGSLHLVIAVIDNSDSALSEIKEQSDTHKYVHMALIDKMLVALTDSVNDITSTQKDNDTALYSSIPQWDKMKEKLHTPRFSTPPSA
jgi:hypothetical protein